MATNNDNQDSEEENKNQSSGGDAKQQSETDQQNNDAGEQEPPPTWLSWAVRGFSLAILLFMLGFFLYGAIRTETKPELSFAVQLDKVEQRGTGWALPVQVTNEGSMSAHTVEVTAALTGADEQPEEDIIIPLLGPNEAVSVTFWFDEDPRGKSPEISVGSYLVP